MDKYDGTIVDERLFAAGLGNGNHRAKWDGNPRKINIILADIGLLQDENAMNWTKFDNAANH